MQARRIVTLAGLAAGSMLAVVCAVSAVAAASRSELLRRSRRSVHTDVYVHQCLAPGLSHGGVAEPRDRGRLASPCTGSHTARCAGAAQGAPICARATSRARCSVIRCVWRRLGLSSEPLVPASDRGSRHSLRGTRSAARRRQDPELSRRVLHRSGDRGSNRSSIVVFRLASLDVPHMTAEPVSSDPTVRLQRVFPVPELGTFAQTFARLS